MKFSQHSGLAVALVLEVVLFAVLSPHFFTAENLLNVTLQTSIIAIIAAGMTFVILTGGIDLSVGSLVAVVGVVATMLLKIPDSLALAISLALAGGIALGALSGATAGLFINRFRMTPFIVTLALMTMWRGAAFTLTEGRPVWDLPEGFSLLASGRILGLPLPTLITIVVFSVAHVALSSTRFGRYVYAVGGNAEAARLAGINTGGIILRVYILCGGLAALSGILLAARVNSGQPNAGIMYELDVIAAVVVGGTSLSGGRGTMVGTLLGTMLIGILKNGLNLLDVGSYVQQILVGAVILVAVLIDRLNQK